MSLNRSFKSQLSTSDTYLNELETDFWKWAKLKNNFNWKATKNLSKSYVFVYKIKKKTTPVLKTKNRQLNNLFKILLNELNYIKVKKPTSRFVFCLNYFFIGFFVVVVVTCSFFSNNKVFKFHKNMTKYHKFCFMNEYEV